MFGSQVLEVAIGIVLVFMLVSIICSAAREGVESLLKTRSAYLEHGIRELLHDRDGKGLAESFFTHPLIYSLYLDEYRPRPRATGFLSWTLARGSSLPSYIPARSFATALLDLAARGPSNDYANNSAAPLGDTVESIRDNILNLRNERVQRVLLSALDSAQGDLQRARESLEAWYDSAMDRVSGWYKRSSQWIIFGVALVVVIGINVNTLTIADYLYRNSAAREALVGQAELAVQNPGFVDPDPVRARLALESLRLPIGWPEPRALPEPTAPWWLKAWFYGGVPLFGWMITALAATLGAPFWFDVLNKVMVIRSTVKPTEKSPEEASEDRQLKPAKSVDVQLEAPAGAAPRRAAVPPLDTVALATMPTDVESTLDACDLEIEDETLDEELPPADGGVA